MLVWGWCQFELSVTWCSNLLPAVPPQGQDRYARVVASSLSALGELVGRSQSPRGEIGEENSFFPFSGGGTEEFSLLYNFCFQQIWLFDNFTLCFMARVKWTHVLRRHVFFHTGSWQSWEFDRIFSVVAERIIQNPTLWMTNWATSDIQRFWLNQELFLNLLQMHRGRLHSTKLCKRALAP